MHQNIKWNYGKNKGLDSRGGGKIKVRRFSDS